MGNIFELLEDNGIDIDKSVYLGIRLSIGATNTTCPISKKISSIAGLNTEIQNIKKELDSMLEKAKRIFEDKVPSHDNELGPDMTLDEIKKVLSSTSDTNIIMDLFNALDEDKRKEVSDYILTQSNVFSGIGLLFSSRYNNDTALLE
ncbi:MAG: hypothetical protein JW932_02060 [Deltaproteobacteria bacterium]|nr:hypothetical protein [Deltaproteobacteria bacterium]